MTTTKRCPTCHGWAVTRALYRCPTCKGSGTAQPGRWFPFRVVRYGDVDHPQGGDSWAVLSADDPDENAVMYDCESEEKATAICGILNAHAAALREVTAERDAQSEEMSTLIDIVVGGYDRSERAEDRLHKARARLAAQSAALEAVRANNAHEEVLRCCQGGRCDEKYRLMDAEDAALSSMRKAGEK